MLEFDKRFFQRQLDRLAKTYKDELRKMQARAKEKAVEYVEKNMSYAKESLTSEMQNIMRQFDKSALERQTIINDLQTYQTRLMD